MIKGQIKKSSFNACVHAKNVFETCFCLVINDDLINANVIINYDRHASHLCLLLATKYIKYTNYVLRATAHITCEVLLSNWSRDG